MSLTNNFSLAASTIAEIYKARWQIELSFNWIKQNLMIKSFLGTSFDRLSLIDLHSFSSSNISRPRMPREPSPLMTLF